MSKEAWKEVDAILADLKKMEGTHSQHPSVLITPLIRTAELHAKITKINEASARKVVFLTWALIALTAALLAFTIALYQDTHAQIQRDSLTKQHEAQHP
jgi:hypothetical protein